MNNATGGMMSGAAQGASAGAVAGPWGAVIGGVVGGVLGLFGGSAQDKALAEENIARNKAVMKYNEKVMLSAADSVSQINLQRSMESQRTSAALFNIQAAETSSTNDVKLRAAASDTLGASVRDASQSVSVSAGRAEATTIRNQENMVEGYNLMTKKATTDAANALQDAVKMGESTSGAAMAGQGAGQFIGLAASMYGKSQTPSTTSNVPAVTGTNSSFDWWGSTSDMQSPNLDFNTNMKTTKLGW